MGKQSYSLINRPTVAEYSLLGNNEKELFDSIIKSGIKANKVVRLYGRLVKPKVPDLWSLSWSDLILLREAIQASDTSEVFKIIYHIQPEHFVNIDIFNCFSAYQWLLDQIKEINEIEIEQLSSESSIEEKNAGVEELEQFEYANSLDMLAGGDLTKYDELLDKPYSLIFRKLYQERVKADIQKRYMDNVSRKAKASR